MTDERGPFGILPRFGVLDFQRRRVKPRPPEPAPPEVVPVKEEFPKSAKQRRKTETPMQTVERFRRRFPSMVIPDPGPEPQPLEGELEPEKIEKAGVVWALETTWGLAKSLGTTEEQQEGLFRSFLPKILPKREFWERETARGMRELLGLE